MWSCEDTDQWPAQSPVVQPSISICLAKEQCRKRLVQAFGHGIAKMRLNNTSCQKKQSFGNGDVQNPLQIPLKLGFAPRPHGVSWPFCRKTCSQTTARVEKSMQR